ncbi:MAG: hypothetical protein HDP34_00155 [Clostridia bacterium]|nr:hypothetical protein [Clostridia bacterium]
MKKSIKAILSGILVGAMAFAFAGCGASCSSCSSCSSCAPGEQPGPGGPGGSDSLTTYQIADYLARGADAHYATYDSEGNVAVAGYYNALEGGTDGYANCYEYGALIGMANRMYDVSEGENKAYYKKLLDGYIAGLDYFDGKGNITSTHGKRQWEHIYGVHRADYKFAGSVEGDMMVYDDLMWLARYFIEGYSYNPTETTYLQKAEYLTKVCLDGWDSTKNGVGGITWGPAYATKHACSNGPILSVLGGLAEVYKDSDALVTAEDTVYVEQTFGHNNVEWKNWVGEKKYDYYLHWLQTIYDWCWSTLRSSDYCYIDLRGDKSTVIESVEATGGAYLKFEGKLDAGSAAKYTYNTGSVLSGAAWLYRLTGDEQYLQQGRLMAEGSYHRFVKTVKDTDGKEHQMYECTSSLLFNSVLLQGYVELADAVKKVAPAEKDSIIKNEINTYVGVFKSSINYAFDNHLLNRSLPQNYIQGWLYGENTMDTHKDVKDAAATPEMLAIIVQYEKNHGTI